MKDKTEAKAEENRTTDISKHKREGQTLLRKS